MNPADWYQDVRAYFSDVSGEYKKITWPPQKETVAGTAGVVVVVVVITIILGFVDFGLSRIMGLMLQ